MIKIAITGGVASGKTEAIEILRKENYQVISSDEITENLLKDPKIINQIDGIFHGISINGEINKKRLSKLIFSDNEAKLKLETILHPMIKIKRDEIFQIAEKNNEKIIFCEIPLLFEKNLQSEFNYSILITCPLETRIRRFIARGSGDQKDFFNIVKNQMLDIQKKPLANFVVDNNGIINNLREKLLQTINQILTK